MSAPDQPVTYGRILKLAAPMILSMSGVMLMQFIDAVFLSWYSTDAIAAVVPAGIAAMFLTSAFSGTAGYTSTFVAQYTGAKQPGQVAAAVWQGIYFSIIAGIALLPIALCAKPLFALANHPQHIRLMEVRFFTITCGGGFFLVVGSALSGFFSGRGKTGIVMVVNVIGLVSTIALDYLLIFGKFGLPELGITGAALATVLSQALIALIFAILFLRKKNRTAWASWKSRAFDKPLFLRLMRFGFPGGIRFCVEMAGWMIFVFFIGRIGPIDLAATNIAWRINGIAFFPAIGLAWRGIVIAQVWMLLLAIIFLVFPQQLFGIFVSADAVPKDSLVHFAGLGVVLLRFVALYCLLDACNYVFVNALVAAGDTRWTLIVSIILNIVFIAVLLAADRCSRTLITEWIIATAFVMVQALIWMGRFMQGKWKKFRVIEPALEF
ncbi:MAG: MATE family efflux transporter [Chitinispirillaceae bacterium]|nr:MATE family efflux transporter [Chitinispirillaceae bacterium]